MNSQSRHSARVANSLPSGVLKTCGLGGISLSGGGKELLENGGAENIVGTGAHPDRRLSGEDLAPEQAEAQNGDRAAGRARAGAGKQVELVSARAFSLSFHLESLNYFNYPSNTSEKRRAVHTLHRT